MALKFRFADLGVARFIDNDGVAHPIDGNHIYGVSIGDRVLGLVQRNPSPELPEQWRAVATLDPKHYPAVDFDKGLWPMTPGRSGFRTRREACVWLLGVADRSAPWFADETLMALGEF